MYKLIITIRSTLLVFLTHKLALPLLQLIRKPELFPFTVTDLKNLPTGTLGHELIHFIEEKDLKLLPYYAKHDIKHLLLEYDTTDCGEVCLQCFMLGNGHVSFPVISTVLYGVVTMTEYWKHFAKAFKRGQSCISIAQWNWIEIIPLPTKTLREKINENKKLS